MRNQKPTRSSKNPPSKGMTRQEAGRKGAETRWGKKSPSPSRNNLNLENTERGNQRRESRDYHEGTSRAQGRNEQERQGYPSRNYSEGNYPSSRQSHPRESHQGHQSRQMHPGQSQDRQREMGSRRQRQGDYGQSQQRQRQSEQNQPRQRQSPYNQGSSRERQGPQDFGSRDYGRESNTRSQEQFQQRRPNNLRDYSENDFFFEDEAYGYEGRQPRRNTQSFHYIDEDDDDFHASLDFEEEDDFNNNQHSQPSHPDRRNSSQKETRKNYYDNDEDEDNFYKQR